MASGSASGRVDGPSLSEPSLSEPSESSNASAAKGMLEGIRPVAKRDGSSLRTQSFCCQFLNGFKGLWMKKQEAIHTQVRDEGEFLDKK
mmetsp:Transcript_666/g.1535  ORF Transcript_666/g.1535 Transcript_666/m.1535 type:complete len:89 (-) Transcript_666:84-350(-)